MYDSAPMNALFLALAVVSARPLAVLPVTGVHVSLAQLENLSVVDDGLRAAVAAQREDVAVQPKEQTRAALAAARAAGVQCTVGDLPCVRKLAVLDEVELVLIPVAAPRPDGSFAVVLTLVDASRPGGAGRATEILPRGKDAATRAKQLVDDVFARLAPAPPDGPPDGPPDALTARAQAPAPDEQAAPRVAAPATTAADADAGAAGDDRGADLRWWIIGGSAGAAVVVGAVAGGVTAWLVGTAPQERAPPPPAARSGSATVVVP